MADRAYEVETVVRELHAVIVQAGSAEEAAEKARRGEDDGRAFALGREPRIMVRAVRRARDYDRAEQQAGGSDVDGVETP